jgi:hypothetical protein
MSSEDLAEFRIKVATVEGGARAETPVKKSPRID